MSCALLSASLRFDGGASPRCSSRCADKQLTNTGLERSEALAKDIAHMQQQWGLEVPVAAEDGPGHTYAK